MGTLSRRAAVLVATLLVLVGACTAGPSSRPAIVVNDGPQRQQGPGPAGPADVPVPALEEPKSTLPWTSCEDVVKARLTAAGMPEQPNVQCSRVTTVLDSPSNPGRNPLRMTVLRAGTGKTPLVVVNDIQGEPGTIRAARLAATLPPEFLTKFSLIGVDRRGSGSSEPVRCIPEEIRAEIVNSDPAAEDLEDLLDVVRQAGQQCVIQLENRLYAMDTWRTAADLDRVRDALGLQRLAAVGIGEGARVLSVYADRFPSRVGRMVFDGLPDPNEDALVSTEGLAAGAEAGFAAFALDCTTRGCPLGPDPKRTFTDLLGQLRAKPLLTAEAALTAGGAARAVLAGLANRSGWPALAEAIAKAKAGDGAALFAIVRPLLDDSREQPSSLDVGLVTACNDTKSRLAVERLNSAGKEWRARYPAFGGLMAQELVLCSAWSIAAQPPLAPTAKGSPPIVVLSTAGDPVTPQTGTERAAQLLSSSVLISWQGAGHGALGQSPCATDAVQGFLFDGKVPTAGTACPP